jgi:hypothetical protein
MNRRNLLIGGGISVVAAAGIWALVRNGERSTLSEGHRALLERVSEIAIPAGETPGAIETQTPAFVELALAHGMSELDLSVVGRLAQELEAAGGGAAFADLAPDAQVAALTSLDQAAFERDAQVGEAWRSIKALIATGYYTSEAGASQELRYELVPGRYDPDVPVDETTRMFSSDWTSMDFG